MILFESTLFKYNEVFRTKGSAAILMNVNTGEILSLVSLPDFDPNQRMNITDKNYINTHHRYQKIHSAMHDAN